MDTNSGKLIKFEQLPTQGQYSQEQILAVLQLLSENPGMLQQMLRCTQQYPEVQRLLTQTEDRCRAMQTRCDTLENVCRTLDMLAAFLKAMVHGCAEASGVAAQAFVDAALHFRGHLVHFQFSSSHKRRGVRSGKRGADPYRRRGREA